MAARKSVRSLIKDESDSENERMEADEHREKANAVNLVLIGFEGLLEVLLKVSDELGEYGFCLFSSILLWCSLLLNVSQTLISPSFIRYMQC